MDLSTGQQRALFVLVVVVLAGLGIYLVGPGGHHGAAAANGTPSASGSATPAPAATSAAPLAQPANAPATSATPGAGGVNIFQWLPFTQQDLAEAARVTLAFAADYDTFSYTQTAASYVAKMDNLVTGEFAASLKNAYTTQGVAAQRSAQKQVSAGSGGIASIRSFGTGSIMFLVNIAQKLTTTKGTSTTTAQYGVTVVPSAGGWQVNDIELATAGNS
jgi:hypothetical protein